MERSARMYPSKDELRQWAAEAKQLRENALTVLAAAKSALERAKRLETEIDKYTFYGHRSESQVEQELRERAG